MKDEIKKDLQDILLSIYGIEQYLKGRHSLAEFEGNQMMRKAIERELTIIGDATARVVNAQPDIGITGVDAIVGMRDRLLKAYDALNTTIAWAIVTNHLKVLKMEVEKLIKE